MRVKVVLTVNSTVINSRDDNGRPITPELDVNSINELKIKVNEYFGTPDWRNVSAAMTYKEMDSEGNLITSIMNIDNDGALPNLVSNENGVIAVIINATNIHMKSGAESNIVESYDNLLHRLYDSYTYHGSNFTYHGSDFDKVKKEESSESLVNSDNKFTIKNEDNERITLDNLENSERNSINIDDLV